MIRSKGGRKGQIAIFVVIALVIIAGIGGYFILRNNVFRATVPSEFTEVYDYYLSCVESGVVDGGKILGTQAGYIELPEFEPGSEYAPFSNQLDFLGQGVPYWYYVSGNGLVKTQVPSKKDMQRGLNDYLEDKLDECDFTEFRRQGILVEIGEASVSSNILEDKIDVSVNQRMVISSGEGDDLIDVVVNSHDIEVASRLGGYYDIAKEIYDYELESMFLEDYSVDVLNLYAPVTGTEISCSPLTWSAYDVVDDLEEALAANIGSLKVDGGYYTLDKGDSGYSVIDEIKVNDEQVNFLYMGNSASRFEIWPSKNGVMMAEVIGPSQGLAAAGFCYVSYKFVYDMYFPVLVQVFDPEDPEIVFQFPVAVVVNKNQPREAIEVTEPLADIEDSVCDNAVQDLSVYSYDPSLRPIEANIEFQCVTDVCNLGKTEGETSKVLETKVPQCTNALLIANAEGYKETKYQISTNEESIADIVLERENKLDVEIFVDGKLTKDLAVLSVTEVLGEGTGELKAVAYPYVPEIELSTGDYEFDLKVYTDKKLTLPETISKQCVDVPKKGILGIFGAEEEECFDYVVPSQTINNVLYAGGKQKWFISQSEVASGTKIRIYAESVDLPSKVEDIPITYDLINVKNLDIQIA
jgi:hypothetical protein